MMKKINKTNKITDKNKKSDKNKKKSDINKNESDKNKKGDKTIDNEKKGKETEIYDLHKLTYDSDSDSDSDSDDNNDYGVLNLDHNIQYNSLYLKKISYQGAMYYLHNSGEVYNRFNEEIVGNLCKNEICFNTNKDIIHKIYITDESQIKIKYH